MPEPVVFISYSHDSVAHGTRVLQLSERLRADGLSTRLDRYVNGSPPEGWPRWMLDQLDAAEWVLVVCTETYYLRFRGREKPGIGKGVDFEGLIITQELYNDGNVNTKFVPVLFDPTDVRFIPEPLRPGSYYTLGSEEGYKSLLNTLWRVAGIEPGRIGTPPTFIRPTGEPIRFDSPLTSTPSPRSPVRSATNDLTVARNLTNQARKWEEVGRLDKAARSLEEATRLDTTNAMALREYGWILLRLRNGSEPSALSKLDQSIRLDPSDAMAHAGRGTALRGLRRWDEAAEAYSRAIQLEPGISSYHKWRGSALESGGRLEDALGAYENAIKLAPNDPEARESRLRLLKRMPKRGWRRLL